MRDEASLARLTELGIEPWVLRARVASAVAAGESPAGTVPAGGARLPEGTILVMAEARSGAARTMLADIQRTLRFAGLACVVHAGESGGQGGFADAAAWLMFGEDAARRAGAEVSADRQRDLDWVVAPGLDELVGNAPGRRAVWCELRRFARRRRHG